MNYFPVFFDLAGQKVLIVGGGEVALRKVSLLERTGALITVVAPQMTPELMQRAAAGILTLAIREFAPGDLDGARLVIVATSRRAVNRWIAKLSESRNVPVNVVDDREASRFIVPAIIDRDPVLVAVSTGGTSPVLARRLRERLEALLPRRIGELASWLKALRRAARHKLRDTDERRRFFEEVVDGPAARRFIEGDNQGAQRMAQQLLARTSTAPRAAGEVILVGAGPGDPELLTLKALRAARCRCHSVRPPGIRRGAGPGAARCGADLRRQGGRQDRQHPGRDHRLDDRTRGAGAARGSLEGRRSLCLRARRRRVAGPRGGAHQFLGDSRDNRRIGSGRLCRNSADASRPRTWRDFRCRTRLRRRPGT